MISGAQFKTPGPNLSGYLPLCNSSDIQSRAPIESCCSCECSALLQIRPWSLKSGYPYNWEHAISDHVCKIWCKNLLMSYKRYVAQAGRGASSSSDWHSIALSKTVIFFPQLLSCIQNTPFNLKQMNRELGISHYTILTHLEQDQD